MRDKTFDSDLDKKFNDEFGQTGKLHFQSKDKIEVQRYKQDCRKRALDLATSEWSSLLMSESKFPTGDKKANSFDILKRADEYYKWLTTITEIAIR